MFIRLKKRKTGNKTSFYAYLVENKWQIKKQSSKQVVKEYLGKAIIKTKKNSDFFKFIKSKDEKEYFKKKKNEIIADLIQWELAQHNIRNVSANLEKREVQLIPRSKKAKIKSIVVVMNDGFLCDYTLNQLLCVKKKKDEYPPGLSLAKALVEAGIACPKEVFVELYEKLASK